VYVQLGKGGCDGTVGYFRLLILDFRFMVNARHFIPRIIIIGPADLPAGALAKAGATLNLKSAI
jgi:hypothetical protein